MSDRISGYEAARLYNDLMGKRDKLKKAKASSDKAFKILYREASSYNMGPLASARIMQAADNIKNYLRLLEEQ